MSTPNYDSEERLLDNPGIPQLSEPYVRTENIAVVMANEGRYFEVSLVALMRNSC